MYHQFHLLVLQVYSFLYNWHVFKFWFWFSCAYTCSMYLKITVHTLNWFTWDDHQGIKSVSHKRLVLARFELNTWRPRFLVGEGSNWFSNQFLCLDYNMFVMMKEQFHSSAIILLPRYYSCWSFLCSKLRRLGISDQKKQYKHTVQKNFPKVTKFLTISYEGSYRPT